MREIKAQLIAEYKAALTAYLEGGGESSLRWAYEFGRRALVEELRSIDLIAMHEQAFKEMLQSTRSVHECAELLPRASDFLLESLSPFELTFRGYRDALNTLQQSEERYRTLVETARDVIYTLSPEGNIKSLNPVFEKLTGWRRSEWLGKSFHTLIHPDDLPIAVEIHKRVMNGDSPPVFEIRIGSREKGYHVEEITTVPEYHNGKIIGAIAIARDITDRKQVQEQLQILAKRVIQAQEEERRNLARELHDDLCQWLSGMKLTIGMMEESILDNKPVSNKLRKIQHQINNRIIEVRRMATTLRPSALDDFGMSVALERLCEDYEKIHKTKITFRKTDTHRDHYPSEVEIAIYRIAQEALSNIVKHANAKNAIVSFTQTDETVMLEIEDDGTGIDQNKVKARKAEGGGLGLISMKERSILLGGTMQYESSPEKGTKIQVQIPFTNKKP
ncbi:MAG: PAS domain S-box protein [Bacteroidota bacterium]